MSHDFGSIGIDSQPPTEQRERVAEHGDAGDPREQQEAVDGRPVSEDGTGATAAMAAIGVSAATAISATAVRPRSAACPIGRQSAVARPNSAGNAYTGGPASRRVTPAAATVASTDRPTNPRVSSRPPTRPRRSPAGRTRFRAKPARRLPARVRHRSTPRRRRGSRLRRGRRRPRSAARASSHRSR